MISEPTPAAVLAALIRTRRTVTDYDMTRAVPAERIVGLLESAVYAPNHHLTEPWRFVLATGAARDRYAHIRAQMTLDKMRSESESVRREAEAGAVAKFARVPAYLLVAMTPDLDAERRFEDEAACAALIQNFLLLAWEQGLATCWKTFKEDARLREFFGLGGREIVPGLIQIGYPAGAPPTSQRTPARDKLTVLER